MGHQVSDRPGVVEVSYMESPQENRWLPYYTLTAEPEKLNLSPCFSNIS